MPAEIDVVENLPGVFVFRIGGEGIISVSAFGITLVQRNAIVSVEQLWLLDLACKVCRKMRLGAIVRLGQVRLLLRRAIDEQKNTEES